MVYITMTFLTGATGTVIPKEWGKAVSFGGLNHIFKIREVVGPGLGVGFVTHRAPEFSHINRDVLCYKIFKDGIEQGVDFALTVLKRRTGMSPVYRGYPKPVIFIIGSNQVCPNGIIIRIIAMEGKHHFASRISGNSKILKIVGAGGITRNAQPACCVVAAGCTHCVNKHLVPFVYYSTLFLSVGA